MSDVEVNFILKKKNLIDGLLEIFLIFELIEIHFKSIWFSIFCFQCFDNFWYPRTKVFINFNQIIE